MRIKNFTKNSGTFRTILSLLVLAAVSSCQKDPVREVTINDPTVPVSFKSGVFVINEGNFNWGNASVTFINKKTDSVFSDIYGKMNDNLKLGDVAQEMKILGTKGFIIVNNSNKIEVVNTENFKSLKTITGLNSPRCIQFVDGKKAYVSNLLKDIDVVDLNSLTVTKTIPTANWTEGMVSYGNYMFVAAIGKYTDPNATRHAKILVIDTQNDRVVDSIKSGKEPLGMVIDRKNKVWVLCTGGFDNFEAPTLLRVDPVLKIVEKTFTFPQTGVTPSRLCINGTKDTLYFLNNGIYKMPVTSQTLPEQPFIAAAGKLFYGLDIDPEDGSIYASDAVDYVQNGWVLKYNQNSGELMETYQAGRIPSYFCFPSSDK